MKLNKRTKIGVVCGGLSGEKKISLRSGINCFNALKRLGYRNLVLINIKTINDLLRIKDKKLKAAFLITHGKLGEDGAIQGIFEWLKIPYTGSSIIGSAISMDKWLTKQIAANISVSYPKALLLTKVNKKNIKLKTIWKELSKKCGAVFLKPRDDGSSINTYKIKSLEKLKNKIKKLNFNKSDYLIEEYIAGKEITVSLIEVNGRLKVLPILELKPENEFYDYVSKYTKGKTKFILPAKLNKKTTKNIKIDSIKIFSSIGCSSFGRVDYIVDNKNKAYMLEVNSLPGMTDTSDLPAQAAHAGIKYDKLVEIILKTARLHNKA